MQNHKQLYNDFFNKNGLNIHEDPARFKKIADLCRGNILDLGCGSGDLADYTITPYLGVDVSDVAINMAIENRRDDAEFMVADLTEGKLNLVEKFDTVVVAQVLEHLSPDEFDVKSVIDYLANNGRVIISVPNCDRVPDPNHVQEFTIPKLRKMFKEFGEVKFYNWIGAEKRIIMTCDVGVKSKNLLSLCMIAKNEAVGLEHAVMSAIEVVDEVVVAVDDSCTDNTREVAEKFADVVKDFTWQDDFSKARNFAQENALGEWILCIDPHEFIKEIKPLEDFLKSGYDGLWARIEDERGLIFRAPRIYRKECVWRDAVHNNLSCKKLNNKTVVVIGHDISGMRSKEAIEERSKQRKEMNQRIMENRIKENKNDFRAMFYLAANYMGYGNPKMAIKTYKRFLKHSKNTGQRWFAVFNIAICYMQLKKYTHAFYYAQRTEKEAPNRWENKFICGVILMNYGRFETSLEYFVECLQPDKTVHLFHPIPFDLSEIWSLIGNNFFQLKQFNKAKIAWNKAIENTKNEARIKFFNERNTFLQVLIDNEKKEV
jgi:glycosyltransferase involved in cell wall biosynthesis